MRNYQKKYFRGPSIAYFLFKSTRCTWKMHFEDEPKERGRKSEGGKRRKFRELAKKNKVLIFFLWNSRYDKLLCIFSSSKFLLASFHNFFFMIQRIYKYYLHDSLDFSCRKLVRFFLWFFHRQQHLEKSDFLRFDGRLLGWHDENLSLVSRPLLGRVRKVVKIAFNRLLIVQEFLLHKSFLCAAFDDLFNMKFHLSWLSRV